MMIKQLLVMATLLLFTPICKAQKPTNSEVKSAAYKIAELIDSNYVLEEKGVEIARTFRNDFKKGRFSSTSTWQELDSVMTKSLHEVSNDGHLYVQNDEELVKQLQKQEAVLDSDTTEEEHESFFNDKKAVSNNYGFREIQVLDDNIGYIRLSQINISEHSLKTLYAAMEMVKNTRALLIDLRGNGGGGSAIGSVFQTYFFEREVELLEFKDRAGESRIDRTVPWLLEKRYLKPVYILIDGGTASAAEAFTFALQHHQRATVMGKPSAGGAYMNTYFPVNNFLVLSVSTAAPFLLNSNRTWEKQGIQPDILIEDEDSKEKALRLILNDLEND